MGTLPCSWIADLSGILSRRWKSPPPCCVVSSIKNQACCWISHIHRDVKANHPLDLLVSWWEAGRLEIQPNPPIPDARAMGQPDILAHGGGPPLAHTTRSTCWLSRGGAHAPTGATSSPTALELKLLTCCLKFQTQDSRCNKPSKRIEIRKIQRGKKVKITKSFREYFIVCKI